MFSFRFFLQPVLAGVDLDFEGAVNAAVEAASGMQLDTVTEAALAVQVPQDDGDEEAANASNANHHFLTHHHHTPEDHPTLPPLNHSSLTYLRQKRSFSLKRFALTAK